MEIDKPCFCSQASKIIKQKKTIKKAAEHSIKVIVILYLEKSSGGFNFAFQPGKREIFSRRIFFKIKYYFYFGSSAYSIYFRPIAEGNI